MTKNPEITAFLALQPNERLFAAQKKDYLDALVPTYPHLTVRDIARRFTHIDITQYPNFSLEISDTQQQLRKLLPQLPPDKGVSDQDVDTQIVSILRKNADSDMGRQHMLEEVIGTVCGVSDVQTMPDVITPEMLAYFNVIRYRLKREAPSQRGRMPYITFAIKEINALETTLSLDKQTFIDRFRYFRNANHAIGMILLRPTARDALDEELYAHLKGAVTGRLVKQAHEKHLPVQTASYPPLLEMDRDWATDGVVIHKPSDSIIATSQTKSTSATIPDGTSFGARGQQDIDWTRHVTKITYRGTHMGNIYTSPICIANSTSNGTMIQLDSIPSYTAEFSPAGSWENPLNPTIEDLKLRFLSARRSVESNWQMLNGAFPIVSFHPGGITHVFGVGAYGQLEQWYQQQNFSYADRMRHLIDACYESVK